MCRNYRLRRLRQRTESPPRLFSLSLWVSLSLISWRARAFVRCGLCACVCVCSIAGVSLLNACRHKQPTQTASLLACKASDNLTRPLQPNRRRRAPPSAPAGHRPQGPDRTRAAAPLRGQLQEMRSGRSSAVRMRPTSRRVLVMPAEAAHVHSRAVARPVSGFSRPLVLFPALKAGLSHEPSKSAWRG